VSEASKHANKKIAYIDFLKRVPYTKKRTSGLRKACYGRKTKNINANHERFMRNVTSVTKYGAYGLSDTLKQLR
jgi:hypothetical protein